MTKLSASAYSLRDDERRISTYADNDIGYTCFHLFPLYFSCGPYLVKKWEEAYFVLNRLFLKVGAWNKSFLWLQC